MTELLDKLQIVVRLERRHLIAGIQIVPHYEAMIKFGTFRDNHGTQVLFASAAAESYFWDRDRRSFSELAGLRQEIQTLASVLRAAGPSERLGRGFRLQGTESS